MKYKNYSKTLPLSEEIHNKLYGQPKTHKEWAEKFNLVGKINRIILKQC